MPSWPGVFQFGIFSSVDRNDSRCISAAGLLQVLVIHIIIIIIIIII